MGEVRANVQGWAGVWRKSDRMELAAVAAVQAGHWALGTGGDGRGGGEYQR